jgi:hypothetical protein
MCAKSPGRFFGHESGDTGDGEGQEVRHAENRSDDARRRGCDASSEKPHQAKIDRPLGCGNGIAKRASPSGPSPAGQDGWAPKRRQPAAQYVYDPSTR